jgi:hypothetical protein
MSASDDEISAGTFVTGSGKITVNTVSITAPSSGFLIISGHVFVNNNDVALRYEVDPKVDGVSVTATGWGATFTAAADGATAAELFELSYTTPFAVTAGAHTVTQAVGPSGGTADFFYNNQELTALFVPSGGIVPALPSLGTSLTGS